MKDFCKIASEYRRKGLSPIPIKPRDKRPLISWEQFQKEPANSEEIQRWGKEFNGANIGIVAGSVSNLVVIDIDTETAKENLKALVSDYDLDAVPRSRTGKGWQLFFAHPGTPIQNRAGVLPGLDVRGDGGYIVAPPSIHPNGRIYRWEVPLTDDLPKLPVELFKLITEPPEQTYRTRFNTAEALNGVEEGRRDETCFKLACKLRNADVPQPMAETLILEAAKNCTPPFPEKTALEKVTRAYQRFQPKQDSGKQNEIWPELLTAKDILQAPKDPTRWILEECLPVGGCSALVAKPKVGKTHLAADMSISISRGEPFLRRATQQSPVAYLFLDGTLPEIADVFVKLGLRESDPVFLHAGSAPRDAIAWIMRMIEEKNVRLVVVDTMQKLLHLRDLNDYAEVTNRMEPVLELARQGKVHVMFLHHAGKESRDDLDAAIGSTAIRGQCYTYLFEKRLPNSQRRILLSDQRGGKNFPETAIGIDRVTGRLEVQGTMEEAEMDEAKPKIAEFLRTVETEVTENEIRNSVPVRTLVASKALRQMLRAGDVERTGKGKKGNPFRYSLSATLMDHSEDCCSRKGGIRGEGFGNENQETDEKPCEHYENSRSQNGGNRQGTSGNRNEKTEVRERESEEGWEEIL